MWQVNETTASRNEWWSFLLFSALDIRGLKSEAPLICSPVYWKDEYSKV